MAKRAAGGEVSADKGRTLRRVAAGLTATSTIFVVVVGLRQTIAVAPNQPVIQMPYMQHHIEATRNAYALGGVETVRFVPNGLEAPIPEVAELLTSVTVKNAPLWPGFCSYLEELVDLQLPLGVPAFIT